MTQIDAPQQIKVRRGLFGRSAAWLFSPKHFHFKLLSGTAVGIVVIAVPWDRVPEAVQGIEWDGQTVIDATNDWAADDLNGRTSSELVADLVAGARLVKAANTLSAEMLGSDPHEAGGQRVIFISGDDADAKAEVVALSQDAGFAAIDLGDLATGGAMQQIHHPLAGVNLIRL